MKRMAFLLFSAAMSVAAPASADVFSSQNFSGETAKLDNLPGVNLQASPGAAMNGNDNCTESSVPYSSFTTREPFARATTCKYGNFSITTTKSDSAGPGRPNDVYGGNPPPWEQGWRPK